MSNPGVCSPHDWVSGAAGGFRDGFTGATVAGAGRHAARRCRATASTKIAPFLAILIVGVLVLVELTAGMIKVSTTTRSASSPVHLDLSWLSTTLIA